MANLSASLNLLTFLSANSNDVSVIAQALSDTIDIVFIKEDIKFDINIINLRNDDSFLRDLADEIQMRNSFPCKIRKLNHTDVIPGSSVILININDVSNLYYTELTFINKSNDIYQTKFIIYCEGIYYTNLFFQSQTIGFDSYHFNLNAFKYYIVNSTRGDGYSLVVNFVKRIPGGNFAFVPVNVNFFNKTTRKWMGNFDEIKNRFAFYRNFTLFIAIRESLKLFYYHDRLDDDNHGILIDFMNIVGKRGSFEPLFVLDRDITVGPQPNGDLIDVMLVKICHNIYQQSVDHTFVFVKLSSINIEEIYQFIITPSHSYTSYNKIFMPFDKATWILLLLTFIVSFTTVLVVNQLSDRIKSLIFGYNVRMPSYNIISVIFGISQTQLPRTDFPRFILAFFIMFCLIFRTAYQGVLYELITTDIQKQPPTTIDELISEEYTFVRKNDSSRHNIMESHMQAKINDSYLRRFTMSLTGKEFIDFYIAQYRNASAKLAFYADETTLYELNHKCECSNLVLNEVLFRAPLSLQLEKNHPHLELIEDTIQHITPFGILQHWEEYHKWIHFRVWKKGNKKAPTTFTLEHLSFGFVMWLSACGISTLGFTLELMHIKMRRHMRTLIGLVLFLILLNIRLKTCAYM